MYRNVIDIRREVPKDVLKRLVAIADKAFNNRAGKVKNVSMSPYRGRRKRIWVSGSWYAQSEKRN